MNALELFLTIILDANSGAYKREYDFDYNTQSRVLGMLKRNNRIKEYSTKESRTKLIIKFK